MTNTDADRIGDEAVLATLESSRLWRSLSTLFVALSPALQTSHVASRARAARHAWSALEWPVRRRALAVTLIVGGLTHVALNVGLGSPVGASWLAIPATAIVVGGLLLLIAIRPARSEPMV